MVKIVPCVGEGTGYTCENVRQILARGRAIRRYEPAVGRMSAQRFFVAAVADTGGSQLVSPPADFLYLFSRWR